MNITGFPGRSFCIDTPTRDSDIPWSGCFPALPASASPSDPDPATSWTATQVPAACSAQQELRPPGERSTIIRTMNRAVSPIAGRHRCHAPRRRNAGSQSRRLTVGERTPQIFGSPPHPDLSPDSGGEGPGNLQLTLPPGTFTTRGSQKTSQSIQPLAAGSAAHRNCYATSGHHPPISLFVDRALLGECMRPRLPCVDREKGGA